ncbi:MAG: cysteine--tRNA ligase [Candidatus Aenigmatarchaeota archaeon]
MLKVYNTLTRKKEEFVPLEKGKVKMFVCGQTVYDDAHLGHAKTYINFDVIVRWLRYIGYNVFYVQNITDIDDKIIKRANERGVSFKELAEFYIKRFFEDMEALGVKQNINLFPKSSEFIPQIAEQIQALIDKGYAYVVDGDVYYDVNKFKDYTKLSKMTIEELKKHRIEPDPRKRNTYDFSLWKSAKPGEPFWEIKIKVNGKEVKLKGRPGWHIEDTAMTVSIFGPQYDLHGGATELIFPHHTNEIAQAEAATGIKPFVKYWLHSGVLFIKGEKMSKSLKNFITIKEALKQYEPEVLRMFYISTHYRAPIDFDEDALRQAKENLNTFYNLMERIKNFEKDEKIDDKKLEKVIEETKIKFTNAMNDDFNTPLALSALFELAKEVNKFLDKNGKVSKETGEVIINTLKELGGIFGILQKEIKKETLPKEILDLIIKREGYRKRGEFEVADKIRKEILEKGYLIEDTPEGPKWKKLKSF